MREVIYQWQFLPAGEPPTGKLWINEALEYTSKASALKYLPVVSGCNSCCGHRLLKIIREDDVIKYRIRVLYTINSRPKELTANANA